MFGESTVVEKYKKESERLNEKIEKMDLEHKDKIAKMAQSHSDEVLRQKNASTDLAERIANKHKDEIERVVQGQDVAIQTATTKLKDENTALKISEATLKDKVEMYEQAFKNLGFDVKDMKEILNKLVDGVVSKNQIQLIGGSK